VEPEHAAERGRHAQRPGACACRTAISRSRRGSNGGARRCTRATIRTRAKLEDIIISPGSDYAFHPALDASRDTVELYGEVEIPVLRDLPFAYRLEIEGAYRLSRYSDNPDSRTWRAGGTWAPMPGLTLRGVFSHSIRVPNFGELFSPIGHATYGHINDPCQAGAILQNANRMANCAALLPGCRCRCPNPNLNAPVVYSGGNPDLTPETSNSFTLGAVLQPKFLRGFDLTVDYWDIRIGDIITSLSYTTILNSCVDSPGGPNGSIASSSSATPTARSITSMRNMPTSPGSMPAASISAQNTGPGSAGADPHRPQRNLSARADDHRAGGRPRRRLCRPVELSAVQGDRWRPATRWARSRFGLTSRFISRSLYSVTDTSPETRDPGQVPAYLYHDLMLQIRPIEKFRLTIGVKNLSNVRYSLRCSDTAPGPHGSGGVSTGAAYYDPIGRYFFTKIDIDF
jgi:iron complex outermembrane receptor protein